MKRFFTISFLLIITNLSAQNLESIGDASPFKISGNFNVTTIGYSASGIPRRDPFNWFLNSNLNVNVYGLSIPFSFNYSNQNQTFSQPFNQYGISPEYKWIIVHADSLA